MYLYSVYQYINITWFALAEESDLIVHAGVGVVTVVGVETGETVCDATGDRLASLV